MIFGPLRRLYHWTIGWADHPAGAIALFCVAFTQASFFPIPCDVLLVALMVGRPEKSFRFAAICTAGSVLGGMAGYLIGFTLREPALDFLRWMSSDATIEAVRAKFADNLFLAIVLASISPIPFKVFTIAAGVFEQNFAIFVLAATLARGARFFAWAVGLRRFGPQAREILEKRFELITIVGSILLVGGFVALKYLF